MAKKNVKKPGQGKQTKADAAERRRWREQGLKYLEFLGKVREQARAGALFDRVPQQDRWRELHDNLWNLYTYSPDVAQLVLPHLLDHKVPDVRGGALYGLIQVHEVSKHIDAFRKACRNRHGVVRDAGIWGLSQSRSPADEKTLWVALWKDPYYEIQESAAYSLRVMPRKISAREFRRAVMEHPAFGLRVELAQRGLEDGRLKTIAREAMIALYPEMEKAGLLEGDFLAVMYQLKAVDRQGRLRKAARK